MVFLQTGSPISLADCQFSVNVVTEFLVTFLTLAPLAWLLSLLTNVTNASKCLPFHNNGAYCVLGNIQSFRNWFHTPAQIYILIKLDSEGLLRAPWTSWIDFWSCMHCEMWDLTNTDVCCSKLCTSSCTWSHLNLSQSRSRDMSNYSMQTGWTWDWICFKPIDWILV